MTCELAGTCHGPQGWCDDCGDVDFTCNADRCFCHRCEHCNRMFTFLEREYWFLEGGLPGLCFPCDLAAAMKDAIARDENEEKAVERRRREIVAMLARGGYYINGAGRCAIPPELQPNSAT